MGTMVRTCSSGGSAVKCGHALLRIRLQPVAQHDTVSASHHPERFGNQDAEHVLQAEQGGALCAALAVVTVAS